MSAIAFFWLTSGTGLRPLASLVEEVRAHETQGTPGFTSSSSGSVPASSTAACASPASSYTYASSHDGKPPLAWLRRSATNSSLPSYATFPDNTQRPEYGTRQTSLPTLMTHGLLPPEQEECVGKGGGRRTRKLPPWELEKPPPV